MVRSSLHSSYKLRGTCSSTSGTQIKKVICNLYHILPLTNINVATFNTSSPHSFPSSSTYHTALCSLREDIDRSFV